MALKLAIDGYDVVCCTSSDERFAALQRELNALEQTSTNASSDLTITSSGTICTATPAFDVDTGKHVPHTGPDSNKSAVAGAGIKGRLFRAKRVDEGVHHRLWVIGKCDTSVR